MVTRAFLRADDLPSPLSGKIRIAGATAAEPCLICFRKADPRNLGVLDQSPRPRNLEQVWRQKSRADFCRYLSGVHGGHVLLFTAAIQFAEQGSSSPRPPPIDALEEKKVPGCSQRDEKRGRRWGLGWHACPVWLHTGEAAGILVTLRSDSGSCPVGSSVSTQARVVREQHSEWSACERA